MSDILITGSSRGIGRAIALQLAREGHDIVLHCVANIEAAEATAKEIQQLGSQCRVLQFNVSDRQQCQTILEHDITEHGAYYGVVCNAGITRDNAFPTIEGEDWDQVIHTNLDAFYNVLHPVIMPMVRRKKPGRIVTLSSVSGLIGNRGQVNYSASKAGIIGATKALAIEMAKRKITVNCVAPGIIDTDMTTAVPEQHIKDLVPMRRAGTTQEVADLVSFLCSTKSSYITRQVISVNGGLC